MALSNIRNEPRREWTEQGIGLLVLLVFVFVDYRLSLWFQMMTGGDERGCPWPLGMLLIGVGIMLVIPLTVLIWYGAHELGESVCGLMTSLGFDPRPKQRYNRR